jgi:hypothetical protein
LDRFAIDEQAVNPTLKNELDMRGVNARDRDGILIGAGAGLTLTVLLVLQSFIGGGLLGTKTVTAAVTSIQQPAGLASGLLAEHMLLLDSRNVSAVVGQYEGNATITWTSEGQCECDSLNGNYVGTANMTQLMKQLLLGINANGYGFRTQSFMAQNLIQTAAATSNISVMVNSTFVIVEQSIAQGKINGTVSAQDSYVYSATGRTWLISRESWDFLSFYVQNPAISGYSPRP